MAGRYRDPRLANPVWSALAEDQASFAVRRGQVARFPPAIAPFVAVADTLAVAPADLLTLVAPDETVDFVAVAPPLDERWQLAPIELIAQMHAQDAVPVPDGPEIVLLDAKAAAGMLALTRLVYPGYFRPRTHELGDYYGIYANGQLVAMAGERMRFGPWQEISAVCTHPDFLGRGYAQRLVANLVNIILNRGQNPFLHVSLQNERAIRLYQHLGFVIRGEIELLLAKRLR